jgi:hypothetical protein
LTERLVEVVHLGQDADYYHNRKDVGARVGELVIAGERELEGNAEALDRHDGNAADGGADGEVDHGVALSVDWRDLVDHYGGEDCDKHAVNHECCVLVSG